MNKFIRFLLIFIYTFAIFLGLPYEQKNMDAAYAQTNSSELCLNADEIRNYLRSNIVRVLNELLKQNDIDFNEDKSQVEEILARLIKDEPISTDDFNKTLTPLYQILNKQINNSDNKSLKQKLIDLRKNISRATSQGDRVQRSFPCLSSNIPHTEEIRTNLNSDNFNDRDFGYLSWQTFIALNWPADVNGKPNNGTSNNNLVSPRVWEFYKNPANVFVEPGVEVSGNFIDLPTISNACKVSLKASGKLDEIQKGIESRQIKIFSTSIQESNDTNHAEFLQSDSFPLIDQNKNYVLYETKINEDEFNYILNNKLYNKDEQSKIPEIKFPAGSKNAVGAIEIKVAWRILPEDTSDEIKKRYYTRKALIYMPWQLTENPEDKKDICGLETVGLVGFHIMHKTEGQPEWIWATFEQVDNTPDPQKLEQDNVQGTFAFWSSECAAVSECKLNANKRPESKSNSKHFLWSLTPPYANKYQPTQVVRENLISPNAWTIVNNEEWHQLFKKALKKQICTGKDEDCNSVWQYYQLIDTQWQRRDLPHEPLILANTTMETYLQESSSCVTCHRGSPSAIDFSFLPRLAKQGGGQPVDSP